MKFIGKHSKFFMFLIDIIIIAVSTTIANLLLCNESEILSNENIRTIINSIVSAIIVYQIYLNIFKIYRHVTRFESSVDYFLYVLICIMSGLTLILIKLK